MAVTIAKLRETFQSPNTLTDSELRAKAESIGGVEVERPNTLAEEWAEKMWGTNYSTNPATARFVMTVGGGHLRIARSYFNDWRRCKSAAKSLTRCVDL